MRLRPALAFVAVAARAAAAPVDAEGYDAFWLWAGVRPQAVLARAHTVYVLQGQVDSSSEAAGSVGVTAQGVAVTRLDDTDVWLVYRAHTLRWPPAAYSALLARLRRWRAVGARIVGVQIDFDARASYLDEYAAFLRDLRRRLPDDCRLGITGLLDWSTNADPADIAALAGIVDEVVVQTYQGRRTIADYRRYLARIGHLKLPFKIGLLQGGEWDAPDGLASAPYFRGYVVFLQNAPGPPDTR